MIKLLIIADDFTGALDTGVKFAAHGIETKVIIARDYPNIDTEILPQVLIMDVETRHLNQDEAYQIIYELTKQVVAAGIPYLYKKTDSALRGNIGSELAALCETSPHPNLIFIPALPEMERVTVGGIHWIEGVPVNKSLFGKDPFEPVKHKYVKEIIREQSQIPVYEIPKGAISQYQNQQGILVCDASTEEEIYETAKQLQQAGNLKVMAGCSGFAKILPNILDLDKGPVGTFTLADRFLVVCGSVNPITQKQLDYGQQHGFRRIRLSSKQKLDINYWHSEAGKREIDRIATICFENPRCILDSNDQEGDEQTLQLAKAQGLSVEQVRVRISKVMGLVLKGILEKSFSTALMITGGDTLLGFMNQIGAYELKIVCPLESGSVLSLLSLNGKNYYIISKSGGFGQQELLVNLSNRLLRRKESC